MPSFSSLSSLENYVKRKAENGLQEVGERVKKCLEFYVTRNIYSTYSPKDYDRTFELLDSITFKINKGSIGGSTEVEIYFDPNKMNHFSIAGQSSSGISVGDRVYIPKWVDEGDTWRPKPESFMKDTEIDLKKIQGGFKYFAKGLVDYLRSQGIQVTKLKFN